MDEYKKGQGAGGRGVEFQVNLLMVMLLNAMGRLKDWKLSTENKDASKFDDAVLELPDSSTLIQAKFKEHKRGVTLGQLLSVNSRNDDFGLAKYFFAYEELKTRFQVKNVIICTNAGIGKDILKFLNKKKATRESILYYGDGKCSSYMLTENISSHLKATANEYYLKKLQDNTNISPSVISEANIKEFLTKFQFYFNYPAENKLKTVIEDLLSHISNSSNLCYKISFIELFDKLKSWCEQRRGQYLTEIRANEMFCEIKNARYCAQMQQYSVSFQCHEFNFEESRKIFHIPVEKGHLLYAIKIYGSLKEHKSNILFVHPRHDLKMRRQIIELFKLPLYKFLVIMCYGNSEKTVNTEMSGTLIDTLNTYDKKKIIVIDKQNSSLIKKFKINTEILEKDIGIQDISKLLLEKIINRRNIVYQGSKTSLVELFPGRTDFADILNLEIVEGLVEGKQIKIGSAVRTLDANVSRNYIRRNLRRKNNFKEELISELNIYDVKEKVILITDMAGMGKTTTLRSLAVLIKKKNPNLWVFEIELSLYCKVLQDYFKNNRKEISVIELLNSYDKTRLTHDLEKSLFSMSERVVLLLDGVDELSQDYNELVSNLLVHCQKSANITKMFVTARPHLTQKLETILDVSSFTLMPFTQQDQIDYLTNYWMLNLQLKSTYRNKCQKYATSLLNKMTSCMNMYNQNLFSEIPLQTRILAEIFIETTYLNEFGHWGGCKEFVRQREVELKLPDRMNLSELYKLFISRKRDIFIVKGNSSGDGVTQQALKDKFDESVPHHRILALEVILNKKQAELFMSYQLGHKISDAYLLRIGIVQKLGERFYFIHRTFAEYFVAESVLTELQFLNEKVEFQKFFIDEVLSNASFKIIRMFLEDFLKKTTVSLPVNMFWNYSFQIKFRRKYNYHIIHLLASEGCTHILKLLLKSVDFRIVIGKECNISDIESQFSYLNWIKLVFGNILTYIKLLLEQGGVNIKNTYGKTPLHEAVENGQLETAKFLVELGANVNIVNNHGETVLFAARNVEMMKFLFNRGAHIHIKNIHGQTSLYKFIMRLYTEQFLYISRSDSEMIRAFVRYGSDINEPNYNSYTIVHSVAPRCARAFIEFLVECGADVDIKSKNGCSAFHFAGYFNNFETIKFLVDCGVDVNIRNQSHRTALHFAALNNSIEAINVLVECGADINVKDKNGFTPLHLATLNCSLTAMEVLLKCGVLADSTDNNGRTALHLAALHFLSDAVQLLVLHGANVDITDHDKRSAIFLASELNFKKTVRFLVANGANLNIRDYTGLTAVDVANKWNLRDIVEVFRQCGVFPEKKLFFVSTNDHSRFRKIRIDQLKQSPLSQAEEEIQSLFRC